MRTPGVKGNSRLYRIVGQKQALNPIIQQSGNVRKLSLLQLPASGGDESHRIQKIQPQVANVWRVRFETVSRRAGWSKLWHIHPQWYGVLQIFIVTGFYASYVKWQLFVIQSPLLLTTFFWSLVYRLLFYVSVLGIAVHKNYCNITSICFVTAIKEFFLLSTENKTRGL